jgi:hypothetical protein
MDHVVHRAKRFKWEINSLLQMWIDGKWRLCLAQSSMKALWGMFMKTWAILGSNRHTICSKHNIGGEGCNCNFNNLFLGVWYVIKCKHLSMHLRLTYSLYQL